MIKILVIMAFIIAESLIIDQMMNYVHSNEKCFMCWGSKHCTKCILCINCDGCKKSIGCTKCTDCTHCIGISDQKSH